MICLLGIGELLSDTLHGFGRKKIWQKVLCVVDASFTVFSCVSCGLFELVFFDWFVLLAIIQEDKPC